MNVDIQLTILAFDLYVDKSQFKDGRYVRSARLTDNNSEVVSVLPSLCSEQGAAPLALLCSYPCALAGTKRFCKSFRTHKAEKIIQRRFYGIHT